LGKELTFSRRKNVNQVRYQRKQKDRNSDAQQIQRALFLMAAGWWGQMTADEQAGFDGYTTKDN